MIVLKSLLKKTYKKIVALGQSCEHLITNYSLLTLSGYFIFSFLNIQLEDENYNDTSLRLLSITLLITLLAWSILSRKYKINKFYFYIFFFFTVTINQSFFFSFMTFKNNFDYLWASKALISCCFLLIIFDWSAAFILIGIGSICGWLYFEITNEGQNIAYSNNVSMFLSGFISLLIYGALFSYRRKTQEELKQEELKIVLKNLKFQSAAIAHEMRTPLANVLMGTNALKKMAQRMEQATSQDDPRKNQFLKDESHEIFKLSDRLGRIARGGQNFINLLLTNLRQDFKEVPLKTLSMEKCLHIVMDEYAFRDHEQEKVHINIEDFTFQGNEELITHVFLNLLKNSLYFIHATGKGEVFITSDEEPSWHLVIFKDTGPGIETHRLNHLFTPFYSKRPHGTGIGLSFCKKAIESMGGRIEASSIFGQETIFTLYLPKSK